MTNCTIKKEMSVWEFFVNGNYVTTADNEKEAGMQLECIGSNEKSNDTLRV
jgi:hypothetical protein